MTINQQAIAAAIGDVIAERDSARSALAAALSALAEAEARAVQEFDIATGYMNERDTLASALAEIRRLCDEADGHAKQILGMSLISTSAIRAALPEETK